MILSSKSDGIEEESSPLVEGANDSTQIKSLRHSSSQQPNIWIFTTIILAFLLLASGIRDYVQSRQNISLRYGYETGFETDWRPAREAIGLKKVKFWGGILFSENQTTFATTNPDPNEPVYVGPPTDAMDDAWYALSHNDSIAVTPEEAREVSDRSAYDKYRKHYTVGVDVLHSLHCLNAIRISQDIEHYRAKGFPEQWWERIHIEHCINHLRQIIQCHGDLTPIPLIAASKNESRKGWVTPDFDTVHTCRDFSAIREWSTEKHKSGKEWYAKSSTGFL